MVSAEIIKRFVAKIKERHSKIDEPTIEKDFYLTLLINDISKKIEENKESSFSKLVFKGGTLLTRAHLNYHRISEDLDFTYLENNTLNKLSSKQRKGFISKFTEQLANEIYEMNNKFSLDFSPNKSDKKYCKVMDRKNVYLFKVYYNPVYGAENFIKIEINFNDELIYSPTFENIKHLFDEELVKDLEFIEGIKIKIINNIPCYDLKEVAGEKIRAVLTRPTIKERDLLDLFLISKTINIKMLKKKQIVNKIASSKSFVKGLALNINHNLELLSKERYGLIEEKDKLVLIDINEKEYSHFKEWVTKLIIEIGEEALSELAFSSKNR